MILVFVLQLLPVKQAVRYFYLDNPITEEIVDINESAAKKKNITDDDDHFLNDYHHLLLTSLSVNKSVLGLYITMLPSSHADDIETPPTNVVIG